MEGMTYMEGEMLSKKMLYSKGKKHQNYKCQHFLMLHKTCKYMLETSKKATFPKFDAGETVYLG